MFVLAMLASGIVSLLVMLAVSAVTESPTIGFLVGCIAAVSLGIAAGMDGL